MSLSPERPLSPHLQIYRIQLTSLMSITHRMTGVGLVLSLHMWVFWLWSIGNCPEGYAWMMERLHHPLASLVLWVSVWSLMYHAWNGVRHLLWDVGYGLSLRSVYATGYSVWVLSTLSTLALWWFL